MDWIHSVRGPGGWLGLLSVSLVAIGSFTALNAAEPKSATEKPKTEISGREIFMREWMPADPRSHGGDGLGPVFNDTSCVACHNLGGAGGGGAASKNVDVLSAFALNVGAFSGAAPFAVFDGLPPGTPTVLFNGLPEVPLLLLPKEQLAEAIANPLARAHRIHESSPEQIRKRQRAELAKIHPGFRTGSSVVLHRFGTDAGYEEWRMKTAAGNNNGNLGGMVTFTTAVPFIPVAPPTLSDPEDAPQLAQGVTIPLLNPVQQRAPRAALRIVNTVEQNLEFAETFVVGNETSPAPGQDDDLSRAKRSVMIGSRTQSQQGNFSLVVSQRNATSIFGAGLLDSIPDSAIEAAAATKHKGFRNVKGRISRLKDNKIGRFGWKAQKATLHDFTMTACAVELGLHVPEQTQANTPYQADYQPAGFDLSQDECQALVGYLKGLPAPAKRPVANPVEEKYISEGRELFAEVGCATCHLPKLGAVEGVFSDLLVHDMGQELADSGGYGTEPDPESPGENPNDEPEVPLVNGCDPRSRPPTVLGGGSTKVVGATLREWRTPPLWGVRDSAPYLHDGRAHTLDQAIAMHGGEGLKSAQLFFELAHAERMQLLAFLKTLMAPEELAAAR